jgi:hypothetical protein
MFHNAPLTAEGVDPFEGYLNDCTELTVQCAKCETYYGMHELLLPFQPVEPVEQTQS